MSSPISVKIEVPVWMKKYLLFESKEKIFPISFPRRHAYNAFLLKLVSNKKNISEKLFIGPVNSEIIKLKLPFSDVKDVYFYNKISEHNRERFRRQVKADFYYDFEVVVKHLLLSGMKRDKALEKFFLSMDITEDDINYDSFYRKFTRYKKNRALKFSKSELT